MIIPKDTIYINCNSFSLTNNKLKMNLTIDANLMQFKAIVINGVRFDRTNKINKDEE